MRHTTDWLEYYLRFTEHTEPPLQYHLWSGISAIASVLQRKCFTNWGLIGYRYPNLYIALVGPPGGRKGTAMKLAKEMIHSLNVKLGSDSLGSVQALYKEIKATDDIYLTVDGKEKHHKSLSIWSEEFQVFLSEKEPKLISNLTDLFDSPSKWVYHSLSQTEQVLDNCWLNIIGAITPSLLQSKLSMDAVGGGLLSRIMLIVGYGPKQKIAFQFLSKEDEELQQKLTEDLQQIKLLTGPFEITQEFINIYGPWYEQFADASEIDSEKFTGYNSRRATHLQKLCMIISASESDDMKLTAMHFKKALAIIEMAEAEMQNAFYGLGNAAHTEVYAKLIDHWKDKDNLDYDLLIKQFQMEIMPAELDKILQLAERAGRIKIEHSASGLVRIKVIPIVHNSKAAEQFLDKTLFSKMRRRQLAIK